MKSPGSPAPFQASGIRRRSRLHRSRPPTATSNGVSVDDLTNSRPRFARRAKENGPPIHLGPVSARNGEQVEGRSDTLPWGRLPRGTNWPARSYDPKPTSLMICMPILNRDRSELVPAAERSFGYNYMWEPPEKLCRSPRSRRKCRSRFSQAAEKAVVAVSLAWTSMDCPLIKPPYGTITRQSVKGNCLADRARRKNAGCRAQNHAAL